MGGRWPHLLHGNGRIFNNLAVRGLSRRKNLPLPKAVERIVSKGVDV
jgi:hypothetical protein